jgi:OmpA-OmpF porin, OOP family
MKGSFFLQLFVFLIVIMSSSVYAEEQPGWPTLTLVGGGYDLDNADLRSEPLYGLNLGYEFNSGKRRERFALELVGQQISGKDRDTGIDLDVALIRLDALYFFSPVKALLNLTPYLTVGSGGRFIESDDHSDSDVVVCYGAGFKFPVTSALSIRTEGRHMLVFSDPKQDDYSYSVGLQWTFGKAKPVKKKVVFTTDSDKDGIYDNVDRCPDTPMGMKVNTHGCPLNPPDSDGDKVPDYLDLCPETAAGLEVNKDGCLEDSDNDGVPNVYDKCPNNPPGFKVNPDGCM